MLSFGWGGGRRRGGCVCVGGGGGEREDLLTIKKRLKVGKYNALSAKGRRTRRMGLF
jgi:hypothetical protein